MTFHIPEYTFERGMKETIRWYLDNTEWVESIVSGDYVNYYEKMYGKRIMQTGTYSSRALG
jgi:dTDP-D-glucose 4,6-dehydratase